MRYLSNCNAIQIEIAKLVHMLRRRLINHNINDIIIDQPTTQEPDDDMRQYYVMAINH